MTMNLCFGELHNHNEIGYGRGSLERSYAIARGALLDVYAFTPHGIWHDQPATDPKMVEFHRTGFAKVLARWDEVKAAADAAYEPGRFVTFHAFEWHSSRFGDYHFIFPAAAGEVFAGDTIAAAHKFAREHGAIMIPHHVGYAAGWRGTNWKTYRPDVSPVVDVFSEHGCGMEAEFNIAMLAHSMGGVQRSQTALEQLRRGLRFGLLASTDNHHGHPNSYNEGVAGIWADGLTREAVFDAIRRRHTFALTGDRIEAAFFLGDAMMGDVASADAPRTLRWDVNALGGVDYVRILRNGMPVHDVPLSPSAPADDRAFVARLEFGWDAMTGDEVTDWKIRVAVEDGRVVRVAPCFVGSDGSAEKLNRVTAVRDDAVELEAFTSRLNARPTSGLALRLEGDAATRIRVEVDAEWKGNACGCELDATIGELLAADAWAAVSDVFSSPRIRLGQVHGASETHIAGQWTDPAPAGPGDWYLLKVLQKNGQAAWTSPIWCGESDGNA